MVYAKEIKKSKRKKRLTSIGCVILSSTILAINIKTFVRAGNLLPGGVTGLSLLLQRIAFNFFHLNIPYFIINIALNFIPVLIGYKMIGKKFTTYSVMVILLNSFLVDIIPDISITSDHLLVAVFGGIINGLAVSIALMGKTSTGGTDFIAVYLSHKFNVSSWNWILGFNVIILLISGMLFGFEEALYSIIFQYVSTQIIELLHQNNKQVTIFIITSNSTLLEKELLSYTHHGITRFDGKGCYHDEPRTLLYTVVAADEVRDVVNFIREIDQNAFINITRTMKIDGRFYQAPIE